MISLLLYLVFFLSGAAGLLFESLWFRVAGLEFEMGARSMSERDYAGAVQHFARVTEGDNVVKAQLIRTLALAMLGKADDAHQGLRTLASSPLSRADAYSAKWLAGFLRSGHAMSKPGGRPEETERTGSSSTAM